MADTSEDMAARQRARRDMRALEPARAMVGPEVEGYEAQGAAIDSEDATAQDWVVAEQARPDIDGETADGLSDLEESVRHAAEDLGADEPLETRIRRKAHELWESEGGMHGRAEDHWRIAAQLVAEEAAERAAVLPYGMDDDPSVEEASTLDSLGEFQGLTDQGDDGETTKPATTRD